MDKPILLSDGNVIKSDDELYPIAKMSASEINRLADNLHWIAKFFLKEELKKALIRKMKLIDTRLGKLATHLLLRNYFEDG